MIGKHYTCRKRYSLVSKYDRSRNSVNIFDFDGIVQSNLNVVVIRDIKYLLDLMSHMQTCVCLLCLTPSIGCLKNASFYVKHNNYTVSFDIQLCSLLEHLHICNVFINHCSRKINALAE